MEFVSDVSVWASLLQEHGYELLGQLDSGSFSEVSAVRSLNSPHRILAAKRMVARREITSDPRILKEITCLKQLNIRGACVIGLEGTLWKLDRLACLLLELAPMGDLERHTLASWPLPPRLVSSALRQLLSALTHCHRLHIAHRDVNPANVLLMSERSVRLADFGLAFHCRDASGRRLLCEDYLGREAYLAPEVLLCAPYDAVQADLWSVSSLCLFMVTGKHPPPFQSSLASSSSSSSSSTSSSVDDDTGAVKRGPLPPDKGPFSLRKQHRRKRRHRCSSFDSEGNVRSESDVDELLSLSSIPDSDSDCLFTRGSSTEDCSHWAETQTPDAMEENVFKQTTAVECAALQLTAKLRVEYPPDRLEAEEALSLWKDISKSFVLS